MVVPNRRVIVSGVGGVTYRVCGVYLETHGPPSEHITLVPQCSHSAIPFATVLINNAPPGKLRFGYALSRIENAYGDNAITSR